MSARDVQLTNSLFTRRRQAAPSAGSAGDQDCNAFRFKQPYSAGPNNVTCKTQPNSLVPIHLSEELSIAGTPESLFKLGVKTGVPVGTFGPNVINTGDINPNISSLGTVLGLPARGMSNRHEN